MDSEAKVSVDPLDNPQVNQAAYDFKVCIMEINKLSGNMGKQGLQRVLNAVAEYPLTPTEIQFKVDSEEEKLFTLTLNALAAKHTMMDAVMQSRLGQNILEEAEKTFKEAQLGSVGTQEG